MVEPIIDPTTGKPVETPPADPNAPPTDPNAQPQFVQIDKTEWEGIKQRLDSFERGIQVGQQQAPQPAQPVAPSGPTFDEQVREIDNEVASLNTKIDEAVKGGQPVSKLMTDRDALTHKRTRMQIKHEDIDPAFSAGVQTIDQLSDEITRGKMKYLSIPDVQQEYDNALSNLTPEQRMNPQMRQAAYRMAVGKPENMDKIMEAQKEEILRSASEPPKDPPPANSRGTGEGGADTVPAPKEVLSRDALNAISMKGITVDEYYKKTGYEGWADFWEKRGKEYFGDQGE